MCYLNAYKVPFKHAYKDYFEQKSFCVILCKAHYSLLVHDYVKICLKVPNKNATKLNTNHCGVYHCCVMV